MFSAAQVAGGESDDARQPSRAFRAVSATLLSLARRLMGCEVRYALSGDRPFVAFDVAARAARSENLSDVRARSPRVWRARRRPAMRGCARGYSEGRVSRRRPDNSRGGERRGGAAARRADNSRGASVAAAPG